MSTTTARPAATNTTTEATRTAAQLLGELRLEMLRHEVDALTAITRYAEIPGGRSALRARGQLSVVEAVFDIIGR